ncbi:MAG: urea ABC transporter ATP-binding subunit UrtE [Pseudomonadota bacterium]
MLIIENLTLRYGQSQILHGVTFEAAKGAITAVMGTNGVGKTSLLKAICGRHPYVEGQITMDGQPLIHPTPYQAARAGIAYVPQGREIFPLLTVAENLETGFACLPDTNRRIPDQIFDLFPVLAEMRDRRGGDLSGGQQQQLSIARALITRPKVLLLDEPTEGIQPNIIQQIGEVVAYLRKEGDMAIVMVEQYFDFAYRLGDRFIAMDRGHVTLNEQAETTNRDELLTKVSI